MAIFEPQSAVPGLVWQQYRDSGIGSFEYFFDGEPVSSAFGLPKPLQLNDVFRWIWDSGDGRRFTRKGVSNVPTKWGRHAHPDVDLLKKSAQQWPEFEQDRAAIFSSVYNEEAINAALFRAHAFTRVDIIEEWYRQVWNRWARPYQSVLVKTSKSMALGFGVQSKNTVRLVQQGGKYDKPQLGAKWPKPQSFPGFAPQSKALLDQLKLSANDAALIGKFKSKLSEYKAAQWWPAVIPIYAWFTVPYRPTWWVWECDGDKPAAPLALWDELAFPLWPDVPTTDFGDIFSHVLATVMLTIFAGGLGGALFGSASEALGGGVIGQAGQAAAQAAVKGATFAAWNGAPMPEAALNSMLGSFQTLDVGNLLSIVEGTGALDGVQDLLASAGNSLFGADSMSFFDDFDLGDFADTAQNAGSLLDALAGITGSLDTIFNGPPSLGPGAGYTQAPALPPGATLPFMPPGTLLDSSTAPSAVGSQNGMLIIVGVVALLLIAKA